MGASQIYQVSCGKGDLDDAGSRQIEKRGPKSSFNCSGLNLSEKSRSHLFDDLKQLWDKYVLIEQVEHRSGRKVIPMTLLTLFKEVDYFALYFDRGIENVAD